MANMTMLDTLTLEELLMADDAQRELGRHAAEIEALKRDLAELRVDVKAIRRMLDEARGGWKTLLLVAGAAGAVGAALAKVPWWPGR